MKSFISAIQFITILPVGKLRQFEPNKMIPFFPIVGLMLGIIVAVMDQAFLRLFPKSVVALLDVICFIFLTGAFHIDGLGDAADGIFSGSSKEKTLAIMKDSRIGVMGLVAILTGLSIKWGGIMSLNDNRSLLLIVVPAYARASMMFGIKFLKYGRSKGTGCAFFNESLKISAFWGLLFPVGISFFLGWKGIMLNLFFIIITMGILLFYKKRIRCITGDMLGAMTEISESTLFLLLSVRII